MTTNNNFLEKKDENRENRFLVVPMTFLDGANREAMRFFERFGLYRFESQEKIEYDRKELSTPHMREYSNKPVNYLESPRQTGLSVPRVAINGLSSQSRDFLQNRYAVYVFDSDEGENRPMAMNLQCATLDSDLPNSKPEKVLIGGIL